MKLSDIYGNDVLERAMPTEAELAQQSQKYEPSTGTVLKSFISDTFKGQGSAYELSVKSDVSKAKQTGTPLTKEEFDALEDLSPSLKYTPDMTRKSVDILNDYHYQRDLNAEIQSRATTGQNILGFTTGLLAGFLEPKQLGQGIIAGLATGGIGAVGSRLAGRSLYSLNATKRALQVGAVSTAIEGAGSIPLDVNTAKELQTDYDYTDGVIDALVGGVIGTGIDIGANKYFTRKARIKAEKQELAYQTQLREDNPFDFSVIDVSKNRNLDADVLNGLITNGKQQDPTTGLYGFLQDKPDIVSQYGITAQSPLKDQIDAYAQYTADNVSFLETSLGRDITASETSLADLMGKQDALNLLQADTTESFLQHARKTGIANPRSFLRKAELPKNATIAEVINYSNGRLKNNLGASPYIPLSKDLMEKIDFKTERAMADKPIDNNQLVAVQIHKNYKDGLKFIDAENQKILEQRAEINARLQDAIANNKIDDFDANLLSDLDTQYAENIEAKLQEFRDNVLKYQTDSGIPLSGTPSLLEIDNEFYKAEFKNLKALQKQSRQLKEKIDAFNFDEQIDATATDSGTPLNVIKGMEEEIANYPLLRQAESDKLTGKRKRVFDQETQARINELKSNLAFIKSESANGIRDANQTAKNQFKSLLSQYKKIQAQMQAKSQGLIDYSETAQANAENLYRQSVLNDLDVLNNPIYDKDLINGLNEITERIDATPDLETQVKKSRSKRVKKPVEKPDTQAQQEATETPKAEQVPPPMTAEEIAVNQKQKRITGIETKIKTQLQQAQIPNTETKHYVNLLSSIYSRAYDRTINSPDARQALDKMFDNLNIQKQSDADSVIDAGAREFLQQTQNDFDHANGTPYTEKTIDINGVTRSAVNSNGQPIAQTKEGLENFYNWFGDSKVVDDKGNPLVVYHGTRNDFESFDINTFGKTDEGFAGKGFYFTNNREIALEYSENDKLISGYLRLSNPLTVDNYDDIDNYLGMNKNRDRSGEKSKKITSTLKDKNFDGVVVKDNDRANPADEYVAFNPEQIKSTSNRGTFDPNDARILYQKQNSIKRGSFVQIPDGTNIINVFKDRDKSTILHETGHFLLETYKLFASTADAPKELIDDWKELENWLGIKNNNITTDSHEKFARGFEAYLMTGDAPSLTLLDMFRQFKQWLSEIYKDIKNLNVSLTPEVKSLFDRMLASPEETVTINNKKVQNSNADVVNIRVNANETIPAKLVIVEAGDLITSNLDDGRINTQYPQELQPRDRSNLASQNQVMEIAKNIDPDVLIHGTSASHGTPIIGDDFIVDSGNGRIMAIRKAIDVNKQGYDTYKQTLIDNGYDISGFKNPVLVRMRINKMNTADRIKFTQKSNQSTIAKMSVSEQAFIDKDAFDNETLSLYKNGKITDIQNKDFVLSFAQKNVSPNDMNDFVTKNGVLSNNGKTRIESALLAKALNNKKIVADYFETTDPDLKSVIGAISDASPQLAYLNNNPNYDLSKNIAEAVEIIKKSRKDKIPVSELVQQTDLERGDVSDLTKQVLRAMHRKDDLKQLASRDKIANIFSDYAQRAIYNDFAEGDIFGEVVTSLDYLKGAIKTAQKEQTLNIEQNSLDVEELKALENQIMQYEKQGLLKDDEIDFIKQSNKLTEYDLIDIEEQATNCLLTGGITND